MAAAEVVLLFERMNEEAGLRQWVEANPGRVNNMDSDGYTPLYLAVSRFRSLSLTVWLLDEKGADVNTMMLNASTALHMVETLDILNALFDRGADPTLWNVDGFTPLIYQMHFERVDIVAPLLQDPRVRATLDVRAAKVLEDFEGDFEDDFEYGWTALHYACTFDDVNLTDSFVYLLQAGANPKVVDTLGMTPLVFLRREKPLFHATIALLEQALAKAGKTSLLVKARRLGVAATSTAVVPSYKQNRIMRGEPLPRVTLALPTEGSQTGDEDEEKERRKLVLLMEFIFGMGGGPKGDGMPRDVFRVVLDLLMLSWDPLRQRGDEVQQPHGGEETSGEK